MSPWVNGYMGAWVHGYMGTWVQKELCRQNNLTETQSLVAGLGEVSTGERKAELKGRRAESTETEGP